MPSFRREVREFALMHPRQYFRRRKLQFAIKLYSIYQAFALLERMHIKQLSAIIHHTESSLMEMENGVVISEKSPIDS